MHNDLKKIETLVREGKLPVDAKRYTYRVLHDSWCQIYRLGECNCDPDISVEEITPENRERIIEETARDLREFNQDIRNTMN